MKKIPKDCWICGALASTGEHKTKKSDLLDEYGVVTQDNPLYLHDHNGKNKLVRGLKSDLLKSPSLICFDCNNSRTQQHDLAWAYLSKALRSRKPHIDAGMIIRANKIFKYNTAQNMLNVHLYFIKLFGCHILEGQIPVCIDSFKNAIVTGKSHPNVYLKFGVNATPMTGMSDLHVIKDPGRNICTFITWIYRVGRLNVNVMFAIDGEKRDGLIDAWHPKYGTNKLTFSAIK